MGGMTSFNSKQLRRIVNSERAISTSETAAYLTQDNKTGLKSRNIYPTKGFWGMFSEGAGAWAFNTMTRHAGHHVLGSAERPIAIDGLTVEEKAILWESGKVLQTAKEEPEEADAEGL